jgi:hypothetical protein
MYVLYVKRFTEFHKFVLPFKKLPAHLVVVKGTKVYQRGKGYEEHPRSTILQMLGRAGVSEHQSHHCIELNCSMQGAPNLMSSEWLW